MQLEETKLNKNDEEEEESSSKDWFYLFIIFLIGTGYSW